MVYGIMEVWSKNNQTIFFFLGFLKHPVSHLGMQLYRNGIMEVCGKNNQTNFFGFSARYE